MPDYVRYVLLPFAKRRHLDAYNVKPEKQVFPESPGLDLILYDPVGGGDNAYVNGRVNGAAHPPYGLFLYKPQKLHLKLPRQFRHLLQKKRSAVRHLDEPRLIDDSPGKSPFYVSEEFALYEILRNRAAVYSHQKFVFSLAFVVYGARREFLSRAALPAYEDVRLGGGDALYEGVHIEHPRAYAD